MEATGGAQRPHTLRDLAEEGKKRAVLLLVFVFGLAFLMSREPPHKFNTSSLLPVSFAAQWDTCASSILSMNCPVSSPVVRVYVAFSLRKFGVRLHVLGNYPACILDL
jgi:hypothetical protein